MTTRALGLRLAGLVGVAITALVGQAAAQGRAALLDSIAAQSDARDIRADARRGTSIEVTVGDTRGDDGRPKPAVVKLIVTAPFTFFENPALVHGGRKDSFGGAPDATLDFMQMAQQIQISARATIQPTRYTTTRTLDGDALSGLVKLKYFENVNRDQDFLPYVSYAPKADFLPTYEDRRLLTQDLAIGYDKTWQFLWAEPASGKWLSRLPQDQLNPVFDIAFNLPFYVQRRLREPGPSSTAVATVPEVIVNFGPRRMWQVKLATTVTHRWVDHAAGRSRRDWSFQPLLTLQYQYKFPDHSQPGIPPASAEETKAAAFFKSIGAPAVKLQLGAFEQSSSISSRSFSQRSYGTAVVLTWKR
jgi:hypothetical protein